MMWGLLPRRAPPGCGRRPSAPVPNTRDRWHSEHGSGINAATSRRGTRIAISRVVHRLGSSRSCCLAALLIGGLGCSDSERSPGAALPDPSPPDTTQPTPLDDLARSEEALAEFAQLSSGVARLRGLSAEQLTSEYPMQHAASLGYSPRDAQFIDRIQASALALNDAELAALDRNGFVISSRQQFPNFFRGYASIYFEHLPVFVSADAMLDAVHRSYDAISSDLESTLLMGELQALLRRSLSRIDAITAPEQTRLDLALYLEVALGLLRPQQFEPPSAAARDLVAQATAADGMRSVTLFGVERLEDFSQFTPRGHYSEAPLSDYFRAMMWLGRVDLRLLETLPDGSIVFRRPQYEAMLAVHQLLDEEGLASWQRIDDVVRAFVGESDSMTVPEVAKLVGDLGGLDAARAASDARVAEAIEAGGYGAQQIASHLMVNDGTVPTLPLSRSFLMFGQRYVADSHVFSEVVFDRIPNRYMPSPLDAAFAALGNNQALALEQSELSTYGALPGALGAMRYLIDSHDDEFWGANLYNLWSDALRKLSPPADSRDPASLGLPSLAGSEAWGRRLLNTQLGSWAQLRHDTLLYAKQSYSGINGCDFPDAYVEPNPEFFRALVRFAERGSQVMDVAPPKHAVAERARSYFQLLGSASQQLAEMAEQQRTGAPFTEAQLAFINDAVRVEQEPVICDVVAIPDGWYAGLFYRPETSIEQDLTIADVHTQPADESGNIVGKVLHVATGFPRLMTMTVNTCTGPRAYTGMAYSYHELVTESFERLDDDAWTVRASQGTPAEVPWAESLIAR